MPEKSYNLLGIPGQLEQLLLELGLSPEKARRGPNAWRFREGSAHIDLMYHQESGFILAEAALCQLPPKPATAFFQYLLEQNFEMESLAFSIKEEVVFLSLQVYDGYYTPDTGRQLVRTLKEKADYFDDILVNRFGAKWISHL